MECATLSAFELTERRVSRILSRLQLYEQGESFAGRGREPSGRHDWVTDVHWALGRLSPERVRVTTGRTWSIPELVLRCRLARQWNESGFRTIARTVSHYLAQIGKAAATGEECEVMYLLSIDEFVRLLNVRRIPDDYKDAA